MPRKNNTVVRESKVTYYEPEEGAQEMIEEDAEEHCCFFSISTNAEEMPKRAAAVRNLKRREDVRLILCSFPFP